jgi:NAD+ synthase (glutamine-hydrolysing)
MSTYGYYRMAAAIPQVRVADVDFNTNQLVNAARTAAREDAAVVVFPELSLTSASCADLFYQPRLLKAAEAALSRFADETADLPLVSVVGLPILLNDMLYNVAAVVQGGMVRGLVPKSIIPDRRESYERRQFSPAGMLTRTEVNLFGNYFNIPIGTDLIFDAVHSSLSSLPSVVAERLNTPKFSMFTERPL